MQARLALLSEQALRLLLFYIVTIDPSAIVQLLRPISSLVGLPAAGSPFPLVRKACQSHPALPLVGVAGPSACHAGFWQLLQLVQLGTTGL